MTVLAGNSVAFTGTTETDLRLVKEAGNEQSASLGLKTLGLKSQVVDTFAPVVFTALYWIVQASATNPV